MRRIAIDVGGTFTDAVLFDDRTNQFQMAKAFSSHDAFGYAMDELLDGFRADQPIEGCIIGGTQVINMIVERKGAKTAFVTTAGFGDLLEIRRGSRSSLYNLQFRKLKSLVSRHLCFEVHERLDAKGKVIALPSIADLDRIVEVLRVEDVEAVAIQFLHSYVNPAHENLCAKYLQDRLPRLAVTASSDIIREWREYERASTAVLNAYVQPAMRTQLSNLRHSVEKKHPNCSVLAVQSNGGTAAAAWVENFPINLIESGPSAGINYCKMIGEMLGIRDLIYLDVGGTTAKCSLLRDCEPSLARDYRVCADSNSDGYPVKIPITDIVEIGTGGGSVAHISKSGVLQVGPRSAGAYPGPACFGRGGEEATLTDAYLETGIIDSTSFAGGALSLDVGRAEKAIWRLARDFGLSTRETASGIIQIANAAMTNALRLVSVRRGYDPRNFVLFACGGGGPLHAATLAAEIGIDHVIVPPYPGYASAWGMMATPAKRDFIQTRLTKTEGLSSGDLLKWFAALELEAKKYFLEQAPGRVAELSIERFLSIRYAGQQNEVDVPFLLDRDTVESLIRKFEELHEQFFSFKTDHRDFEVVTCRLKATLPVINPQIRSLRVGGASGSEALICERRVDLGGFGSHSLRVFGRNVLAPDFEVAGPAIVEEDSATTVILPGQRLKVDQFGVLHIFSSL
jgi:N-methylhydantoinase A